MAAREKMLEAVVFEEREVELEPVELREYKGDEEVGLPLPTGKYRAMVFWENFAVVVDDASVVDPDEEDT